MSARLPRVLALMGSGETAPTMAKVHRALVARLPAGAPGVVLDTPYGFQENADELTARATEYFERNVGHRMTPAPLRRADGDALAVATAVARAREAAYLFAGPGSPSYALAHWRATPIPGIVADKLREGGIVTFASAAALTVGAWTVPVYEIYKVGADPAWLPGLDLLAPLGLHVAVIPHYDNAEGGTHDTRFCYLGERRLSVLEERLPPGHFVLGVDSHTALILDVDAGTATVEGAGGVTVRAAGRSHVLPTGSSVPIEQLAATAHALMEDGPMVRLAERSGTGAPRPAVSSPEGSPLGHEVRGLEARFETQLTDDDVEGAVGTLLALDQMLLDWSGDTEGTGDIDRARAAYRACIVRLGEHASSVAAAGSDDRLAPLVDLLVDLRGRARVDRDWRRADWIRDALLDAGIEVHDGADSTTWVDGRAAG